MFLSRVHDGAIEVNDATAINFLALSIILIFYFNDEWCPENALLYYRLLSQTFTSYLKSPVDDIIYVVLSYKCGGSFVYTS